MSHRYLPFAYQIIYPHFHNMEIHGNQLTGKYPASTVFTKLAFEPSRQKEGQYIAFVSQNNLTGRIMGRDPNGRYACKIVVVDKKNKTTDTTRSFI